MDKQNVAHIHIMGYYLAIKKERSTDAWCNTGESQKHYAKMKEADTKCHILYTSI